METVKEIIQLLKSQYYLFSSFLSDEDAHLELRMTPDKVFFPDDWDEYDVIEQVKKAYNDPNRIHVTGNTYEGKGDNNFKIWMYLDSNDRIISAFPK